MHITNCLWGHVAWITISLLIVISGHYMYVKLFLLPVLFEGISLHTCMWVFIFILFVSEGIYMCLHKAQHHFSCDVCKKTFTYQCGTKQHHMNRVFWRQVCEESVMSFKSFIMCQHTYIGGCHNFVVCVCECVCKASLIQLGCIFGHTCSHNR
jgi:hypothetical protein